jgi:hypothetical protein
VAEPPVGPDALSLNFVYRSGYAHTDRSVERGDDAPVNLIRWTYWEEE